MKMVVGCIIVTDDIMNELLKKHPKPVPIQEGCLLFGPVAHVPENYFDEIDKLAVFKAAQVTRGAGGPSHMDADHNRNIIASSRIKNEEDSRAD